MDRCATSVPLNDPHTSPITTAQRSPTTRGTASVVVDDTPYPASIMHIKLAQRLITEPTEISVPAEADTTNVIPIARMATSEPLFIISIIRPYRIVPFVVVFLRDTTKKDSGLTPVAASCTIFTAMTRIRARTGRKSGHAFILFHVFIMTHLPLSPS